jgi:lipid II isoglutaminyl synthase (glutamine-hydrolysing)
MSSGRTVQRSPAASARRAIAVSVGKATHSGVRHLGEGNGTAIPGRVALAIDPGSLGDLVAEIRRGSILVTGSAGKGTTCRMLAQVMRTAGLHPVQTAEGSDQRSGLATAMIAHAARTGHLRIDPHAVGLFEADEGSFAEIIRHVAEPAAVVCTNIFRDRLDRYAEPAHIKMLLEQSIRKLPVTTTLILNADDPRVADLAADLPNPRLYFGMSDPIYGRVRADPTSDFPRCPRCDGELAYACVYYAHLGHWTCAGCGLSRPQPDVSVTKIDLLRSASTRLHLATGTAETVLEIPLPGLYNSYNALAAVTAATQYRLPAWSLAAIRQVTAGSLRMERIKVTGHDVYLALAKNANGYTEVLRAVLGDGEPKRMLLGLNDCAGKQPDTSWIWDVDFDSLAGLVPAPVLSGTGAADLAVRLKYAGWLGDGQDHGQSAGAIIEPDPVRAFQAAIAATPPGQPLWIVATSTVLSQIRRWLRRTGYARDLRSEHDGRVNAAARAHHQPSAAEVLSD